MKRRISTPVLINIVLVTALILVSVFGYFYYLKVDPVDRAVNAVLPADTVVPYKFLHSIYGNGKYALNRPEGVTLANNRVWVADTGNKRIVVFDKNGDALFEFGNKEEDEIKLSAPVNILVDGDRVFVVDIYLRNIIEYTSQGQLVGYFGRYTIPMPSAMAKYKESYVVLDMVGPGLVFLNQQGEVAGTILAGGGSEEGKLEFPQAIEVLGDYIYVTDSNNDRLQYTTDMVGPLKVVEVPEGSEFGFPYSIASYKGRLFVGGSIGQIVRVYDQVDGQFEVKQVIQGGDPEGHGLSVPVGIDVDNDGKVYVVDIRRSRIMVFEQ